MSILSKEDVPRILVDVFSFILTLNVFAALAFWNIRAENNSASWRVAGEDKLWKHAIKLYDNKIFWSSIYRIQRIIQIKSVWILFKLKINNAFKMKFWSNVNKKIQKE